MTIHLKKQKRLNLTSMSGRRRWWFTTGKCVFSRNPITETNRELAVVGGRGQFRFAKGFVLVKTHSLDTISGDAVLEYNAEVVHH
ncbi:Dirigent protein 15 [Striga hermonthica]|uniref:Dirigent protein n=1 Tax=Striga hermonthica TaxID=68872 RepID=A0A9N7MJP6_STRHE|nr:Dirigent protein 15 [Striga hermonthica]